MILPELINFPEKSSIGPDCISSHVIKRCVVGLLVLYPIYGSSIPEMASSTNHPCISEKRWNKRENYRPLSLTSIFSKGMESLGIRCFYFLPFKIYFRKLTRRILPHCLNTWSLCLDRKTSVDLIYFPVRYCGSWIMSELEVFCYSGPTLIFVDVVLEWEWIFLILLIEKCYKVSLKDRC